MTLSENLVLLVDALREWRDCDLAPTPEVVDRLVDALEQAAVDASEIEGHAIPTARRAVAAPESCGDNVFDIRVAREQARGSNIFKLIR